MLPSLQRTFAPAVLLLLLAGAVGHAASLRFHGNGVDDLDRVKVRIDDPATATPGPPADVGAGDFTIELWLRGTLAENASVAQACGANLAWIYGNVVLDRDRYSQDRKFGLSLASGFPVFGVSPGGAYDFTVCGDASVLDGAWHHVAVQRRASDGWLWMYVDGAEVASEDGPDGPLDYPDAGVAGPHCGGPCVNSDPFVVFGAEKHDAGSEYPSFAGWLDEVRFSTTLRYPGPFTRPSAPFTSDFATAALWHFDEAAGDTVLDSAPGGASGGRRHFGTGGARPAGPEWSADTPFATAGVPSDGLREPRLSIRPVPSRGEVLFGASTARPGAEVELLDASGRRVARVRLDRGQGRWNGRDDAGRLAPAGVYFARLADGRTAARVLLLR